MYPNVDCVVMTSNTFLADSYFPGGYFAPFADAQNNWNLTEILYLILFELLRRKGILFPPIIPILLLQMP